MHGLVAALVAVWVCAMLAASHERAGDEPARLSFDTSEMCEQWQQGALLPRVVESVCRREALHRRY